MILAIDLTNKVFDQLTVLEVDKSSVKVRKWKCQCSCGNFTSLLTNKITSGHTRSCGCIKRETTKTNGFKNKEHGHSHLKNNLTYKSWCAMRYRCSKTPKEKPDYEGRGITICPTWNDYLVFLKDMGERPKGTTLDREDVNGNYCKTNCRWASAKTQQRNRRNTNFLYHEGGKRIAMEIADELEINKTAMQYFISVSRKMKDKYGYVFSIENNSAMVG